jgi:hypothetical protein
MMGERDYEGIEPGTGVDNFVNQVIPLGLGRAYPTAEIAANNATGLRL